MPQIRMSINISLSQDNCGSIRVEENLELPAMDFLELAKVMGQFHDLAHAIRNQRSKVKP
jgi:hypothetical protein